ncbi:ferritin-like domain-containing protein [Sphingomonas sp. Leaf343]|uniref:ferritin-like domain-containing protein n=1 Tax=Sphingomonas sp. Leaf343 TaxID=1736345 RepID=UPI0006FFD2B1|nr:ferritin-like domain-containing protein [Sphingomonas sp. Leaf343]KQR83686.1 hypothetical protein ASG07_08355 [Sphingomonas sp. Leaf343]
MTDSEHLIAAMDNRVRRRDDRREFFKAAFGVGAFAVGGAAALSFSTKASAQSITDADILNFALNLEYLEAQFYQIAANGAYLPANLTASGGGTAGGTVTGGSPVTFTDPIVAQYAREIAADEVAHVTFLRSAGALGTAAVAMPNIDIRGGAGGPFGAAAAASGLPATFDPYSSDANFLLGAYIFEDVGVTAYKGASPLVQNKTFLQAAAGILAVEAYHAAIVRTTLYGLGVETPALRTAADNISNARDTLDGTATDRDQGISPVTRNGQLVSNIVPADPDTALAFSRTPQQVLNIVYLNNAAATMGGFFPNGVNGNIKGGIATL